MKPHSNAVLLKTPQSWCRLIEGRRRIPQRPRPHHGTRPTYFMAIRVELHLFFFAITEWPKNETAPGETERNYVSESGNCQSFDFVRPLAFNLMKAPLAPALPFLMSKRSANVVRKHSGTACCRRSCR